MTARVEKVDSKKSEPLIRYGEAHGREHDESFLPGRDFKLSPEYPAYLLWDDDNIAGAVVLMRTQHYRSAGKGRFSMLHSSRTTREAYSSLLDAIRPHFQGLRSAFLFLPEAKRDVGTILEGLGFTVDRISYVLENPETSVEEVHFPDGFSIHPLAPTDQTGIREFADCVNESFRDLAGHVPSSPEDFRAWFDEDWFLEGGLCLLKKDGATAGTVCVMREQENKCAAEIGALTVVPRYRGAGLGRMLLRHARSLALAHGLHPAILCVNAENEKAIQLYQSEGFLPTETMVCYSLDCAPPNGKADPKGEK